MSFLQASLILEVGLRYWERGGNNSAINRKTATVKVLVMSLGETHIKANGGIAEVHYVPATLQSLGK